MTQGPEVIRAVQISRELTRILNLPKRTWSEQDQDFALELSQILKRPEGEMTFRPIQAMALLDIGTLGGLLAPIRVGGGKTLISVMAPLVAQSRRPLLLTRANLIEKTKREARELAYHWPIPNYTRFVSYELLGRSQAKDLLDQYQPDLIIADEAHRLKNPKAAVTRRVARYLEKHPGTKFVAMSGTITKRSLKDYAHLAAWALRSGSPIPLTFSEVEDWSEAIDEKPHLTGQRKVQPGALLAFCTAEERQEKDLVVAARKGFRRRLVDTPGVVASAEGQLGCSLTIQALEIDVSPKTDEAFQVLRNTWTTPDGWPISDPMTLWRHARELALGFYYRWDPRPPREWIEAKKEIAAWVRYILGHNHRQLDSELQVINAIDQGLYPDAAPAMETWRRVKPTFQPNTVPVWLDDSVIEAAGLWALQAPGIIWTEHVAFAERLAYHANLVYYGKKGKDSRGRPIESHDPAQSLIASEHSSGEGRNLQGWNRNLIISVDTSGDSLEQLLGRTHRPGQLADEVTADIVITCLEHVRAFEQARKDARYQEQVWGIPQKLNYADIVGFPSLDEIAFRPGARWTK